LGVFLFYPLKTESFGIGRSQWMFFGVFKSLIATMEDKIKMRQQFVENYSWVIKLGNIFAIFPITFMPTANTNAEENSEEFYTLEIRWCSFRGIYR
jgi:hypothetical protein